MLTVKQTPDTDTSRGDLQALAAVAEQFQLGEITHVRVITEGVLNRNWQVITELGPYAVKQVLDATPDKARRQHEATAALADRGLPVPAPLYDIAGDTLWETGEGNYSVLPWVTGIHRPCLSWTLAECGHVGGLLAQLHDALAETMPAVDGAAAEKVAEPAKAKAAIDRYEVAIASRPLLDDFDRLAQARLRERRDLLERVAHLRPDETALVSPVGWGHGDFHDLNLLWGSNIRINAVVDWDRMSPRSLAGEVVRSATLMFQHGDERGLDLERVAAFTGGYTADRPLTPAALADAEHRLWWDRVCDLWQLKRHYDQADTSCDHLFISSATLLAWWSEHRSEFLAALGA